MLRDALFATSVQFLPGSQLVQRWTFIDFDLRPIPYLRMTTSLAKYHARAPRYILHPQDNTLIRVAGPKQIPWEEGTEIRNISLSGLAFTAPTELCPIVGEFIKIEFEAPGTKRMACFGLVTRLEPDGVTQMLVGIHFVKLEMPHRVALLQGLAQKLKEQQQRDAKEQMQRLSLSFAKRWPKLLLLVGIFLTWLSLAFFIWGKYLRT